MEPTQNSQVSSDPETKGFDLSAGKTWIYPENYPVRDYQFNIVQACLYKNTLVCLPTGLGKTFIAAVMMYNFWRWYPCGKVVFLAPTKPLVAQQIFACHNIMGIPSIETIELTGAINQKQREVAWSKKRVVFATPQVFHNDLEKNIIPADLIKCVVIDEAHKALGKHSYCECIRILKEKNHNFRLLALSATPGNKIDNVHEVIQNLLIAHVELRDETSLDIIPYINERKVDIILVPLNKELTKYKDRYIYIMDRHVKVLLHCNVLKADTANISKGRIFHLLREFQKKTNKSGNYGQIIKTLNILMTMYHAYELMIRDGLRAFHKFYQNHSDKFWMNEEIQLQELLEDMKEYLGPFPDLKTIQEDSAADISRDLIFGHTKFEKLKELLLHHFKDSQDKETDTRAIVFVEYRDIVNEIYILLLQCQPLIRPQMFVGQAGQKQKQQLKALENFRNNHVNVLISTSIGEEGLDVGEVDLIICFDVSQHSPTRLVQRMGRTGRKRDGHIIILVTDGKEHETLKSTMARRVSLNNKILNTSNIFSSLYQNNPRMIPDTLKPECLKMHIRVQPKTPVGKGKDKKSNKKNNKRQNALKKITAIDSDTKTQKNGSNFSMTKFFKTKQHEERAENNKTPGSDMSQNKNTIKPSDVKILSRDNDAVDFLTLCALRNSEKETDPEQKCKNNKLYVPEFPRMNNFFNFSIPDITILGCLITLEDVIPLNRSKSDLHRNENKSMRKGDNLSDAKRMSVNRTKQVENRRVIGESKFEDLLDDSSKSNESDLANDEENHKNDHFNCSPTIYSQQYPDNNILKIVKVESQTGTLDDLEPGIFEDVLNEMSDDSESNIRVESSRTKQSANNERLDSDKESSNAHLRETIEPNDGFTRNCKEIINDNHKSNLNESKTQSILSITQAINEIARLHSKSTVSSRTVDESEDDMFLEESFLAQIDNATESIKKEDNSLQRNESNDKTAFDKSTNLDAEENLNDMKFTLEEYQWDDDFEISTNPVRNSTKFNLSGEKSQNSIKTERNFEMQCPNNQKWISVDKSPSVLSRNATSSSISKKLANVRNKWKSGLGCKKKLIAANGNLNSDTLSTERNVEIESSYFFSDLMNDESDQDALSEEKNESQKTKRSQKHNRGNRKRRKINEFIDDEAEVSLNNYTSDESSEMDTDLEDFVSHTQNVHDTTDMHVHYLKTVRSPIKRHEGFLFREPRPLDPNVEIYSQAAFQPDDTYLNDSFCVAEDENEHEDATAGEELCELEKAEKELERRKRKRKRADGEILDCNKRKRRNKRRNNYDSSNTSSSSSTEDEIENLRKQIMDESQLLAQSRGRLQN